VVELGIHKGLKIPRSVGHAGSTPASGTNASIAQLVEYPAAGSTPAKCAR
jgi:hypothetical protein